MSYSKVKTKTCLQLKMCCFQVLLQGIKYDDLNEVAKLFAIHED